MTYQAVQVTRANLGKKEALEVVVGTTTEFRPFIRRLPYKNGTHESFFYVIYRVLENEKTAPGNLMAECRTRKKIEEFELLDAKLIFTDNEIETARQSIAWKRKGLKNG